MAGTECRPAAITWAAQSFIRPWSYTGGNRSFDQLGGEVREWFSPVFGRGRSRVDPGGWDEFG
jgi:hypothetical protein